MYCLTVRSILELEATTAGRESGVLVRSFDDLHGVLGSGRQRVQPLGRQVFEHALASAFASVARFAIAAEAAGGVELVGAVDPDHSGFDLRGEVERDVDVLAPDAGGETIDGVVGQLRGFCRRAEGHGDEDRPEDLFLNDGRAGMHVSEQSGREEAALLRHWTAWLPATRALGDAGIDHFADGFKLHGRHDCSNIDGFIERRAHAERFHARADFCVERFGHALLHEKARACAADLALIEPDGVDEAFDCGVEVGIVKDDER